MILLESKLGKKFWQSKEFWSEAGRAVTAIASTITVAEANGWLRYIPKWGPPLAGAALLVTHLSTSWHQRIHAEVIAQKVAEEANAETRKAANVTAAAVNQGVVTAAKINAEAVTDSAHVTAKAVTESAAATTSSIAAGVQKAFAIEDKKEKP